MAYTHVWPWPTFVYVRRVVYNAERNEGRRLANSAGHQEAVGIVRDGSGGAILVWQDARAGFQQTYAQRLLPDLSVSPGWPEDGLRLSTKETRAGSARFQLGTTLLQSSVAADGNGGAFVVWTDLRENGASGAGDIYAQHVRGDGTLAPGWPEDGLPISRATGDQSLPRVAADGAGGAYLVWQDARGGDPDIYVQHVTAEGVVRWKGDGRVLCDAPGAQERPVISAGDDGGALVAWVDGRDAARTVYAARIPETQVAVLASLREAEATHDRVRLVWWLAGTDAPSVVIEKREATGPWTPLGSARVEAGGWVRYEDRAVAPLSRYAYRVRVGEVVSGEVAIETPGAARLALEGARPNPSRGGLMAVFELPDAESATLELVDAAGRRMAERSVGGLGAGRHVIRLAETDLAPGLYFLRLTRADRSIVRRAAIVP